MRYKLLTWSKTQFTVLQPNFVDMLTNFVKKIRSFQLFDFFIIACL